MANRKPFLEKLISIEGVRREALLIAVYFIAHHYESAEYVEVSQKKLKSALKLKSQPNVSRGVKELVDANFLQQKNVDGDPRKRKYRLKPTK